VDAPGKICGECFSGTAFITEPCCVHCGVPFSHAGRAGRSGCVLVPRASGSVGEARAALRYDGRGKRLLLPFKARRPADLGKRSRRWENRARRRGPLLRRAELIVPRCAATRRRLFVRRYNQAPLLAQALAGLASVPAVRTCAAPAPPSHWQLGATARTEAVAGAFAVRRVEGPGSRGGTSAGRRRDRTSGRHRRRLHRFCWRPAPPKLMCSLRRACQNRDFVIPPCRRVTTPNLSSGRSDADARHRNLTQEWCPYCTRAKVVFDRRGVGTPNRGAAVARQARAEAIRRSGGRSTVPTDLIDGVHIGWLRRPDGLGSALASWSLRLQAADAAWRNTGCGALCDICWHLLAPSAKGRPIVALVTQTMTCRGIFSMIHIQVECSEGHGFRRLVS